MNQFTPRRLRDDGIDPDYVSEAAAEAEYIPESEGVAEFLSALADDMHTPGAVRTMEGDDAAQARSDADRAVDDAAQRADAEAEVRSEARRLGIDLAPEEISHIAEQIGAHGLDTDEAIVDFVEAKAMRDVDESNDIPGPEDAIIEIPFEDFANADTQIEPGATRREHPKGPESQEEDTAGAAQRAGPEREEPGSAGEGGAVEGQRVPFPEDEAREAARRRIADGRGIAHASIELHRAGAGEAHCRL